MPPADEPGLSMGDQLSEEDRLAFEGELYRLQIEHRDLDAAILALEQLGSFDQLQIQRLKKRKLQLKDRIIVLSDRLTPDIIA
jgi:hypothetical protein